MTDPEVTQVDVVAGELLDDARRHHSRRAAQTLITGPSQRATLIALAKGAGSADATLWRPDRKRPGRP